MQKQENCGDTIDISLNQDKIDQQIRNKKRKDLVMTYKKENFGREQNLKKCKVLNTDKCFNYRNLGYFERDYNQLNVCPLPTDKSIKKKL